MKFDVIIGNPPYQEMDGGGTGDSSKPIYNLFISNVINYKPQLLSFIIPSKWMKGGKGLDNFRNQMIEDKRLKELTDFENAKHIFSTVDLDGGVCYFLWDSNYNGKVKYSYIIENGKIFISNRYLKTNYSDTIIRDIRQCSIIEKIYNINKNYKKFDSLVSSRNPYGFATDLFNNPKKYSNADLQLDKKDGYFKVYGVIGKKGGAKRITGYVNPISIKKNIENIKKYKLFFSYSYSTNSTIPPELIIGLPNQISTETFLEIGTFNTIEETKNCLKYIKTKLFRALLFFNRIQKNASKKTFKTIPIQDFTSKSDINWDKPIDKIDEQLFKKYELNEKEINYIKQNIKSMK